MELKLEVLSSLPIKEKKPWPRLGWLQEYQQSLSGLYLFDSHQLCQVSGATGKTNRAFPALGSIKSQVSVLAHSPNGAHLVGLVSSGDMFLWHKSTDEVETYVTPFSKMGAKNSNTKGFSGFKLYVSDSGEQVLMLTSSVEFYLWEVGPHAPQWWKLFPPRAVLLPQASYRETAVDAGFYVHQVLEEICVCGVVFNDRHSAETTITHLLVNWPSSTVQFYSHRTSVTDLVGNNTFSIHLDQGHGVEENIKSKHQEQAGQNSRSNDQYTADARPTTPTNNPTTPQTQIPPDSPAKVQPCDCSDLDAPPHQFGPLWSEAPPFNVSWGSISCQSHVGPTHNGHGTYVYRLSPSGDVSALAVNERKAGNTRVLFFSSLTPGELSTSVYPTEEDSRSGRTYWIVEMSWSADGLFLACMTKRGSLVLLPRFGPPLRLVTSGCSMDMGPSTHLPLHPLITVTGKTTAKHPVTDHENSESSERDTHRQRFSVCTHPSLSHMACSDGYTFTVLRWDPKQDLLGTVWGLVSDTCKRLGLNHSVTSPPAPPSHHNQGEDSGALSSPRLRLDIHEFMATITEGSELTAALNSSLRSLGGYFADLDAGEVHFAGTSTYGPPPDSSMLEDCASRGVAMSLLQATVAIMLSCEPFMPCNGMLPSTPSMEMEHVSAFRSQLQELTKLLVSAVSKVVSDSSTAKLAATSTSDKADDSAMLNDFITSILKLVTLDKLKQNHLDVSLSVANAILLSFLTGLVEGHCNFTRLSTEQHSLQSLTAYVSFLGSELHDLQALLEESMHVFQSTYSARPSLFGKVVKRSHTEPPAQRNCVDYFMPSLRIVQNLIATLWRDVKTCKNLARPLSHSSKDSGLARSFKNSYSVASSSVKSIHCYVLNLLSSSRQQISTPKRSPLPQADSKPITYHHTTHADVKTFLENIQKYDMQAVFEAVNECVHAFDNSNLDEDQVSDILDSSVSTSRPEQVCLKSVPARFMARVLGDLVSAYFTDQSLLVLLSSDTSLPARHAELVKSKLTSVLQDSDLIDSWTVERGVNLLLLSDKWERACNFIVEMGDWRKAFVLAVIFVAHHREVLMRRRGVVSTSAPIKDHLVQFSQRLALSNILKVLGGVFKRTARLDSKQPAFSDVRSFNSPGRLCESFLSETFYVCALVQEDSVLRGCVEHYLEELCALCACLSTQVPQSLYLPAPPLHCAQPALTEEEFVQCPKEQYLRMSISSVIQTLSLVLKLSNSLLMCAQWYSCQLRQVVLASSSVPAGVLQLSASGKEDLPALLKELAEQDKLGLDKGSMVTSVGHLLGSFRKFCALLWFLHVRDQSSRCMRKLQPSLHDVQEPGAEGIRREAAIWSSKLLPFADFLSVNSSHTDIQDLVLSVLSELPCDEFLADTLAFCFPQSEGEGERRGTNAKLKRIMTRLRATGESSPNSQPLLVRYQAKSRQVIASRTGVFGNHSGSLPELLLDREGGGSGGKDLRVGNVLFEYDKEYHDFLDTLFSIIVPPLEAGRRGRGLESDHLPFLSEFHKHEPVGLSDDSPTVSCLYPLLSTLIRWAQMPYPQKDSEAQRTGKAAISRKIGRRRSSMSIAAMRVNLSVPVVMGCLRETEEEESAGSGGVGGGSGSGGQRSVGVAGDAQPSAEGGSTSVKVKSKVVVSGENVRRVGGSKRDEVGSQRRAVEEVDGRVDGGKGEVERVGSKKKVVGGGKGEVERGDEMGKVKEINGGKEGVGGVRDVSRGKKGKREVDGGEKGMSGGKEVMKDNGGGEVGRGKKEEDGGKKVAGDGTKKTSGKRKKAGKDKVRVTKEACKEGAKEEQTTPVPSNTITANTTGPCGNKEDSNAEVSIELDLTLALSDSTASEVAVKKKGKVEERRVEDTAASVQLLGIPASKSKAKGKKQRSPILDSDGPSISGLSDDLSGGSPLGIPLLHVPEGVLQGHFTPQMADQALGLSPARTASKPHTDRQEGSDKKEPPTKLDSTWSTQDMVSNTSAGELPSDLTFSYGEVGFKFKYTDLSLTPNFHSTANPLTSTVIPEQRRNRADNRRGVADKERGVATLHIGDEADGLGGTPGAMGTTGCADNSYTSVTALSETLKEDDLSTLTPTDLSPNSTLVQTHDTSKGSMAEQETTETNNPADSRSRPQSAPRQPPTSSTTKPQVVQSHVKNPVDTQSRKLAVTSNTINVPVALHDKAKDIRSEDTTGLRVTRHNDKPVVQPSVHDNAPFSKEDIRAIVRTEIEPIIQKQHDHLLSALQRSLQASPEVSPRHVASVSPETSTGVEDQTSANTSTEEDTYTSSVPPVLELEDLQSSTYSEPHIQSQVLSPSHLFPSPVHFPSHPIPTSTGRPITKTTGARKHKTHTAKTKARKARKKVQETSSVSDVHLSDLYTDTTLSPGAIPSLTSSEQDSTLESQQGNKHASSQQGHVLSAKCAWEKEHKGAGNVPPSTIGGLPLLQIDSSPVHSVPVELAKSSQQGRVHGAMWAWQEPGNMEQEPKRAGNVPPPSTIGGLPLLQIDSSPVHSSPAELAKCSLEEAYPDVMQNLRNFDQCIVTPTRQPGVTTGGLISSDQPDFPLLSMGREAEPLPGLVQDPIGYQPQPVSIPAARPFTPLPPHSYSNQTQVPMELNLPPPLSLPPQQTPQAPVSALPQTTHFPLLSIPGQAPSTHHTPSHAVPDYQLPSIPLIPFQPLVFPPPPPVTTTPAHHQPLQQQSPRLLIIDDPLSKMKAEGFKLLSIEPENTLGDVAGSSPNVEQVVRRSDDRKERRFTPVKEELEAVDFPSEPLSGTAAAAREGEGHGVSSAEVPTASGDRDSSVERPEVSIEVAQQAKSQELETPLTDVDQVRAPVRQPKSPPLTASPERAPSPGIPLDITHVIAGDVEPKSKPNLVALFPMSTTVPEELPPLESLEMRRLRLQGVGVEQSGRGKTVTTPSVQRVDRSTSPVECLAVSSDATPTSVTPPPAVPVSDVHIVTPPPSPPPQRPRPVSPVQLTSQGIQVKLPSEAQLLENKVTAHPGLPDNEGSLSPSDYKPSAMSSSPVSSPVLEPRASPDVATGMRLEKEGDRREMEHEAKQVVNDGTEVEEHSPGTSFDAAVQVGFKATPPVTLPYTEDAVERELRGIDALLDTMRSGSSKGGTMEQLLQLDEQLKAIETTARQMEGGLKDSSKLLKTIDNLNKLSDEVDGVHTDSEEGDSPLDHTPDPLEELLLNSVPNTSTPKLKVPPLWVSGGLDSEEEGVEDTRMKKKKKGDTTISSMVLPSEEKLSKENLRKYVKERKGKKLAEFVGLRESRGARDVSQTTVSPSRSPLHSPVQNKSRKFKPAAQRESAKRALKEDIRTKRVADAYTLMNDILSSKPITHATPSRYPSPRPISPGQSPKKPAVEIADRPSLARRPWLSKFKAHKNVRRSGGIGVKSRTSPGKGRQNAGARDTSKGGGRSSVAANPAASDMDDGKKLLSTTNIPSRPASLELDLPKKVRFANTRVISGGQSSHSDVRTPPNSSAESAALVKRTQVHVKVSLGSPEWRGQRGQGTNHEAQSRKPLVSSDHQMLSQLLDFSDHEQYSISSGASVMSNIDWEKVDKILDS